MVYLDGLRAFFCFRFDGLRASIITHRVKTGELSLPPYIHPLAKSQCMRQLMLKTFFFAGNWCWRLVRAVTQLEVEQSRNRWHVLLLRPFPTQEITSNFYNYHVIWTLLTETIPAMDSFFKINYYPIISLLSPIHLQSPLFLSWFSCRHNFLHEAGLRARLMI